MFLQDQSKRCQVFFPMLAVDDNTVDVNEDTFDVSQHCGKQKMKRGLRFDDPQQCAVPLELPLAWYPKGGLSCLLLTQVHLPGKIGKIFWVWTF